VAITLVTAVGSASANSYATLAEAIVVAGEVFPKPDAWLASGNDDKGRAMLQACRDLDQERFPGDRADTTQALAWPRAGVRKLGGTGWTYGLPAYATMYLPTEIPALILRAQILRAIQLVEQAANGGPDDLAGVAAFGLGGEVSMTLDTAVTAQTERDRYFATVIRPLLGHLVYTPQLRMVR